MDKLKLKKPSKRTTPPLERSLKKDQRIKQDALKKRIAKRKVVLEWIYKQYPFMKKYRPMKLGILKDLQQVKPDDISGVELRKALGKHTRHRKYLKNTLHQNAKRYDLHGKRTDDKIEPEHRKYSKTALTEINNYRKKNGVKNDTERNRNDQKT